MTKAQFQILDSYIQARIMFELVLRDTSAPQIRIESLEQSIVDLKSMLDETFQEGVLPK